MNNLQPFLHFSALQYNTQQFPRIVIYSGKGVVFLTAVKVRYIVSREAGPVFAEQKEFTTHPHSLPLSLHLSLVSVWAARQPAARAVGWFGVDERKECVAPSVVV